MTRRPTLLSRGDRRGVAALEFAIVAPVMVLFATAGFDIARALVVWQEVQTAVEFAAISGQNLAASTNSGSSLTLTTQQAKAAMTEIYAAIPQILGTPAGGAKYAITMSAVQWYTVGGTWTPYLAWTTSLYGLAPLETTANYDQTFVRSCTESTTLTQVAEVPGDVSVLTTVPTLNMTTQQSTFIIVDVHYQYKVVLPLINFLASPTINYYSSFIFPNLNGANLAHITFDGGNLADGWNCPLVNNT